MARVDGSAAAGAGVSAGVSVDEVLADGAVHSLLQPIVDLASGSVVAYEALARGPVGTDLERPDVLFAAAREQGRLAELDALCRRSALRAAVTAGVSAPLGVFVNVEPEALDAAPLDDLLGICEAAPDGLRVVLEITERALASRPAELLRTVQRVRSLGWAVALDDVGADEMSLAFMPLLRPEVVKLDLRLVQQRPGPAVAQIMNAVGAYAERNGATVLAEGIEDDRHLAMARALGAQLGQGWLFGRPAAGRTETLTHAPLALAASPAQDWSGVSPFGCLPAAAPLRRSAKPLLIEVSKHLEREALRHGSTTVVAATFQDARHFTPRTADRYRELVERTAFVAALGQGLGSEPVTGVRGAALDPCDPLTREWDIVVLGPHFAAALLARDLGDTGPDLERSFEFALTYDRDVVTAAAQALLGRVVPRLSSLGATAPRTGAVVTTPCPDRAPDAAAAARIADVRGSLLLRRALAATTNGVTIADATRPDFPLVYANTAFERLSGYRAEEVLGRTCRFLQGEGTDPASVARIRRALAAGRECRVTILNHRGPQRTPWWNEIYLAPVFDDGGTVVQYIGVQNDVTERVAAETDLRRERDRAARYAEQVEELAWTEPLTGLLNRRRVAEVLEEVLWEARAGGGAAAVVLLDLDGFKAVNDSFGHAAGDDVLREVTRRLRGRLRRGDHLARLGGDEFLVVLPGLDAAAATEQARQVAADLVAAAAVQVPGRDGPLAVGVSAGVAVYPGDGEDFDRLVSAADARMYAVKHATR